MLSPQFEYRLSSVSLIAYATTECFQQSLSILPLFRHSVFQRYRNSEILLSPYYLTTPPLLCKSRSLDYATKYRSCLSGLAQHT